MIAPEPMASRDPRAALPPRDASAPGGVRRIAEPVGTLRGAGVNVDTRRAARVAGLAGLIAIAVVAVVLFVAGYQKNAQITSLQTHGVAVDAKVTGCVGLLGGSGSNAAGYNCTATYEYGGRHYAEGIPGTEQLRATGSTIKGIVASDDPALFSTPAALAAEHTSARVYVVPTVLAALFVVLSAVWLVMWRRGRLAPRSAT
jgi:hypothetical protein